MAHHACFLTHLRWVFVVEAPLVCNTRNECRGALTFLDSFLTLCLWWKINGERRRRGCGRGQRRRRQMVRSRDWDIDGVRRFSVPLDGTSREANNLQAVCQHVSTRFGRRTALLTHSSSSCPSFCVITSLKLLAVDHVCAGVTLFDCFVAFDDIRIDESWSRRWIVSRVWVAVS